MDLMGQGGVTRMGIAAYNTAEEIDYTVATYAKVIDRLRGMSATWDEFQSGLIDSAVRPRVGRMSA